MKLILGENCWQTVLLEHEGQHFAETNNFTHGRETLKIVTSVLQGTDFANASSAPL